MVVGVLSSGNLGFFVLKQLVDKYNVEFVMTDKGSTGIIEYCVDHKIPHFIGNPRVKDKCDAFINDKTVDVLISVNYLFLIEENLIKLSKKLTFNIHGSLLPKYRGRTPHVWSIINGEKKAGITAHEIDLYCDTGDILEQIEIPILDNDTGASILEKYKDNYFPLIESVMDKLIKGKLEPQKQNDELATYYGKRVPDDGIIDWNWQKERIYNWVRAQAYPYPGAYTYLKGKKVIIDKISFSNIGYDYNTKNGSIVAISPSLLVKTQNGLVALETVRNKEEIKFEKDKEFGNE